MRIASIILFIAATTVGAAAQDGYADISAQVSASASKAGDWTHLNLASARGWTCKASFPGQSSRGSRSGGGSSRGGAAGSGGGFESGGRSSAPTRVQNIPLKCSDGVSGQADVDLLGGLRDGTLRFTRSDRTRGTVSLSLR